MPHEGPLADLLWSDPDPQRDGFSYSQRGAGYVFGGDAVRKFLHTNNVEHMVRAHQLCMDGYQVLFEGTFTTVWSAPNYCYRCGNLASVLEIDENLNRFFNTFHAAPASERPSIKEDSDNLAAPDYFL